MSIRCAQCGSKRVKVDTNSEGFSVGKAMVGTVLFGAGGAIMGVNGKKTKYYHCGECGVVLSYCMPDYISSQIDDLLSEPDKNAFLLSLNKQSYPNIEWNGNESCNTDYRFDTHGNMNVEDRLKALISCFTETGINYQKSDDTHKKYEQKVGESNEFYFDTDCIELEKRGVLKRERFNEATHLKYYSNPEDIKNNLIHIAMTDMGDKLYKEHKETFQKIIQSVAEETKTPTLKKDLDKALSDKILETGLTDNEITINAIILNQHAYARKQHLWVGKEGKYRGATKKEREAALLEEQKIKESLEKEKQKEIENCRNLILSTLKSGEYMAIHHMLEYPELKKYGYFKINNQCIQMVEEGIIGKSVVHKSSRFYLPSAVKAKEEALKKQREEIAAYNAPINAKIAKLQEELHRQQSILQENKYKIFGKSAKLKKEAIERIPQLEQEIASEKNSLKPMI